MKQQLNPRAVWLFFFNFIWRWLFLIFVFSITILPAFIALLATNLDSISGLLIALIMGTLFFIVLAYLWSKLSYKYYLYEIAADGFRKEQGVIWKKYTTIPYGRIQNVDIYRGLLARLLGLSDLHIQTAGASAVVSRYGMFGAGAEGRLQGLSPETAEQLRDELIRRAKGQHLQQGL